MSALMKQDTLGGTTIWRDGEQIAECKSAAVAAAFVRACNAHEALLAAVHVALTSEDGPALRDVLRAVLRHAGGLPDDFDLSAALAAVGAA